MTADGTTTVLLIRHAQTDAVDRRLAGREPIALNQVGRAQAERLTQALRTVAITAVYCSPLERAVETATPLARERGLRVEPKLELMEVDFGAWTGAGLAELAHDPAWQRFNRHRSFADVPGGERALDVQARVIRALDELRVRHPNETVVCVTHADVIRLALLHVAGAPIDFIHRFEISPASVTRVVLNGEGAVLGYVNAVHSAC